MGHTIDPLGYDKLQKLEPGWSEQQYRLVEPYLNIVSNPPGAAVSSDEAAKKAALVALKAIYADRLPSEKWSELERVLPQTVTADQFTRLIKEAFVREARSEKGKSKPRRTTRSRRTARNGGTPVDCPYETRIVDDSELLPLLNQG